MAGQSSGIPNLGQQSPAIDFIDNEMPGIHEAFANTPTRYDSGLQKYVPVGVGGPTMQPMTPQPQSFDGQSCPPRRELPVAVRVMRFWDRVFPRAMELFTKEHEAPKPRTRKNRTYCIRDKKNWSDVQKELEDAREAYTGTGFAHYIKRGLWTIRDNVQIVRPAVQILDKVDMGSPVSISPVLASVQIVLDAAKVAQEVGSEVTEAFGSNLEERFALIEELLAIFDEDPVIEKASVKLVAHIFKAVEDAIGYYLANKVLKVGQAVIKGKEYQKELRDSIKAVKSSSDSLMVEAHVSDMHQTRQAWNTIEQNHKQLKEMQTALQGSMQKGFANMQNHILALPDHEQLSTMETVLQQAMQQGFADMQNYMATLLDGFYQKLEQTLEQRLQPRYTPSPNPYLEVDQWGITRRTPSPQPLYQSQSQYPQQQYLPPPLEWHIPQPDLQALIGLQTLAADDMEYIKHRAPQLSQTHQEQAQRLVTTPQFRAWITAVASTVLLIQGNYSEPSRHEISALSLFCATLSRALAAQPTHRFRPLVFFCGRHLDAAGSTGGHVLARSLIAQLLAQQPFDTTRLHTEIDLNKIQSNDLDELCRLLSWLARRIPAGTTIVCLIDGVGFYETRHEHRFAAGVVMKTLLELTRDLGVASVVKILFTSPAPAEALRAHPAFRDGGNVVAMAGLARLGMGPSERRFARELGDVFM
ncbi:hypothetical protein B0T19DRAFT_417052 [Cercophora scortea]|uniref:Fungal STAND N-terminal Goodbye domain-containing protein n=1 Tax=Cercophora scortea TaxID=314031 RepID=A0AAE0MHQ8_9PEZI|nr:hypothetical protein B0T19DRAFT_417052 [Cercophora scortea]